MKKLLLLLLIIYCQFACAQDSRVLRLDSFFNLLEKNGLALGNVSIAQNGKIQYRKALGYAYIDSTRKIPASVNTRYRIGSETKMFTAVIIFQLIEEGKLRPDDKLSKYFPELPNAGKITISQLLNHRSGLHNYTEGTNFPDWMDKPTTHEQLLKIISEKGSDFEPGTKAGYSNTNYLLLGYIIEKVSGMSYEKMINNRIVSKAGLNNTYYGGGINTNKGESASYKYAGDKWNSQKKTDLSIHAGAGSLVSTTGDMVKFMEALFNHRLVSRSSLNTMTALVDGYGMGLFPFNYSSRPAFGHNGRIEEFYSSALYFPAEKLSVSYITNGIFFPRADIMEAILKIWFKDTFVMPFSKSVLRSEDLDQYLGTYTSEQMQITVNCTKKDNKLLLETRGTVFETVPISEHYFMHTATGYFFHFFPGKNELLIKETDNIYYLKRAQ